MKATCGPLEGIVVIEPKVFGDARGFFYEMWSQERYKDAGVPTIFKQDNVSLSAKGILRGLHFQNPNPQGKLVSVLHGTVFDVVVDLRQKSPTFGKWFGIELSGENHTQLYVPPGFAHGFMTLTEQVLFHYKCTEFYSPEHEYSLIWNDPDIGITWPMNNVSLSAKDQKGMRLCNFSSAVLFE